MAQPATTASAPANLEHSLRSLHTQRPRPPDLDVMHLGDEHRVPLRPHTERIRRRDSRLFGLFGRHKTNTVDPEPNVSSDHSTMRAERDLPSRSGSVRASVADMANWPYSLQPAQSEATITATNASQISLVSRHDQGTRAPAVLSSKSSRGTLTAAWSPPPLFQAYPQAISYIKLPACAVSADAILRMYGRNLADQADALPAGSETGKRRDRRNNLASLFKAEWTTKIYVLVTSGHLLQYAGEGAFDRLPERVLRLGKNSAAFASDVIPGKHWVVQVSAFADPDGTAAADPRTSILSRLPFRVSERRQASVLLMVFECAEEMDRWIALLRREIEHLGGKKNLSETGRPKETDSVVMDLREQPSQRTLVLRNNPERRFSRPTILDYEPWKQNDLADALCHSSPEYGDVAGYRSFDDMSATNSVASHDGRQLDSLRDDSNRFSIISSSQRTIVTSEGSSPSCSPIRTSFSSQFDETPPALGLEVQPRPNNAQATSQRRTSMRVAYSAALADVYHPEVRPSTADYGSMASRADASHSHAPKNLPASSPSLSPEPRQRVRTRPAAKSAPPRTSSRRAPPLALGSSRPLSVVPDHPSPFLSQGVSGKQSQGCQEHLGMEMPEESYRNEHWEYEVPGSPESTLERSATDVEIPPRLASLLYPKPRHTLSRAESRQGAEQQPRTMGETPDESEANLHHHPVRSISSLADYERSATPPGASKLQTKASFYRRGSMFEQSWDATKTTEQVGGQDDYHYYNYHQGARMSPQPPMTPTRPQPGVVRASLSLQNLRPRALSRQPSLHKLTEGPPPAPPPTCALPPIPPRGTRTWC